MENVLVYAALGMAAFTSLAALYFFISSTKKSETVRELEEKLTLEQAKRAEFTVSQTIPKKKTESAKTSQESSKHSLELIELRKNSAHLRDEIKHLKAELRNAENLTKELSGRAEGDTFKLRAENQALIERLREIENNSTDKKRAAALEQELNELRVNFKNIQSENAASSAKLKSERVGADKQKQTIETLQQQVRELKARLPDETTPDTAKIDPKVLERWKERAFTARHMYQMMRQMRELSDLKLSTYQEAVIDVSKTLLTLKGAESPEIGPRENKADRYLAEAWSLVQPDTSPNV